MVHVIFIRFHHPPYNLNRNTTIYHALCNHLGSNILNIPCITGFSVTLQIYVFRFEIVPILQIAVTINKQSVHKYLSCKFFICKNFSILCFNFFIVKITHSNPNIWQVAVLTPWYIPDLDTKPCIFCFPLADVKGKDFFKPLFGVLKPWFPYLVFFIVQNCKGLSDTVQDKGGNLIPLAKLPDSIIISCLAASAKQKSVDFECRFSVFQLHNLSFSVILNAEMLFFIQNFLVYTVLN